MENHYFDANGLYTGSAPAHPASLPPANATRTAPPSRPGFWPVRRGDGWELAEDHRGRRGWVGGVATVIATLGPLPQGWQESAPLAATPLLYLTPSGTYHLQGCRYTRGPGEWLEAEAIRSRKARAKACGACRPPAL